MPQVNGEYLSPSKYKRLKRKQFKAALKAIDALCDGSAFLPWGASVDVRVARRCLKLAQAQCRPWWKGA